MAWLYKVTDTCILVSQPCTFLVPLSPRHSPSTIIRHLAKSSYLNTLILALHTSTKSYANMSYSSGVESTRSSYWQQSDERLETAPEHKVNRIKVYFLSAAAAMPFKKLWQQGNGGQKRLKKAPGKGQSSQRSTPRPCSGCLDWPERKRSMPCPPTEWHLPGLGPTEGGASVCSPHIFRGFLMLQCWSTPCLLCDCSH